MTSKEEKAKVIFRKYDKDKSGTISLQEFQQLLPDIGIDITTSKSIEYFRLCDVDGNNEIDFDEFRVCLFVCDGEELNPSGFNPGNILRPKDAFFLFDKDQSGQLDETEFHFVLKYLGIEIEEGIHEKMFKQYDKDGSGFIEYEEFQQVWLRLADPKRELENRGIMVPTLATRPRLIQMLEDVLKEEEEKEKAAITKAKHWRKNQIILKSRKQIVDRALWRSDVELSAALDAGGQVYVFGNGSQNQFSQCMEKYRHVESLQNQNYKASNLLDRLWKNRVEGKWVSQEGTICDHNDPVSSPFNGIVVQGHTSSLWARGIQGVAISDSTIIAHSFNGQIYSWGTRNERWWHDIDPKSVHCHDTGSKLIERREVMPGKPLVPRACETDCHNDNDQNQFKNTTLQKLDSAGRPITFEISNRFVRLKRVLQYYDLDTPPIGGEDSLEYAETRIQNKIQCDRLIVSLQIRGIICNKMTKTHMLNILYDEIESENGVLGEVGHSQLRKLENDLISLRKKHKFKVAKRRQLEFGNMRRTMTSIHLLSESKMTHSSDIESNENTAIFQVSTSPLPRSDWSKIAAGANHAGLLDSLGQLYTYGSNASGQLGNTERSQTIHIPSPIKGMHATEVSCGYSHSAAINDGDLYVWGSSAAGKLGLGVESCYQECITIPTKILTLKKRVSKVSCGASHTACSTDEGHMYVWGSNSGYRLGLGHCEDRHTPTEVSCLSNRRVVNIACGNFITLAATAICQKSSIVNMSNIVEINGGELFVAGRVLGDAFKTFEKQNVFYYGDNEVNPKPVEQLSAGFSHQSVVTIDGELFTWGDNRGGCCGHNPLICSVRAPRHVDCLYTKPNDLAYDKPARGSSVYGNQPFYEIDLGSQCTIQKITLWNELNDPANPAVEKGNYASCIFPFWIMVSQIPFSASLGEVSLCEALKESIAKKRFDINNHASTWVLPRHNKGRFVRVQLEKTNLLKFERIEVMGIPGTDSSLLGQVSSVTCGKKVTVAVVNAINNKDDILLSFKRAVSADGANKGILDQYAIYKVPSLSSTNIPFEQSVNKNTPCILCIGNLSCELCQLKFEFRNILDSKLETTNMNCLSSISSAVLKLSKDEPLQIL